MSLLDNGPHTVVVTPKERVWNERYNSWDLIVGEPVTVERVAVQAMGAAPTKPVSEAVATVLGEQIRTNLRVIGRHTPERPWPGGPWSTVEWQGRVYDQEGEAAVYEMSRATTHFSVTVTARSLELR